MGAEVLVVTCAYRLGKTIVRVLVNATRIFCVAVCPVGCVNQSFRVSLVGGARIVTLLKKTVPFISCLFPQ